MSILITFFIIVLVILIYSFYEVKKDDRYILIIYLVSIQMMALLYAIINHVGG